MAGLRAKKGVGRRVSGVGKRPPATGEERVVRHGTIPVTLIEADTVAGIKAGLVSMAAGMRSLTPCYARILTKFAEQIEDGYSSAAAVVNYTAVPEPVVTVDEVLVLETTHKVLAVAEIDVGL